MIKVTLLGDSIRQIGYGTMVPKLLGSEFEVFQPEENCRFSKYTLRGLFDWKEQMEGSRIIHWNNGLWDASCIFDDGLFTDEEEYVKNMLRIAKILKERYEAVIFATTTPLNSDYLYTKNKDVRRYNELIVPRLEKMGIIINDLHSLVASDIEKYICEDKIHLSGAGIKICANQVAEVIRKAADKLKK